MEWIDIGSGNNLDPNYDYNSTYDVQGVNRTQARKDKEYHAFRTARIGSLVSKVQELTDEKLKSSIKYQKNRGSYPEYLRALRKEAERRDELSR